MTSRKDRIVAFIREHVGEHGYAPTVREIAGAVGLASPASVHTHLAALERAGVLRRALGSPRALVLCEGGDEGCAEAVRWIRCVYAPGCADGGLAFRLADELERALGATA